MNRCVVCLEYVRSDVQGVVWYQTRAGVIHDHCVEEYIRRLERDLEDADEELAKGDKDGI